MPATRNSQGQFERTDSDFMSRGTRCAGWLYRPEGKKEPPIVLMAHGFAAERTFRLPAFAERFVERGLAVLLFDYRNFGDSDGKPRNLVNPFRHGQDWDSAIAHVQSSSNINTNRIALWGSSLGGGHVVAAAARHPEISAIVAQVPFVGGIGNMPRAGPGDSVKAVVAAFRDAASMLTRRGPYCVPVIGTPETFALMNAEECWPGYSAIIPEGSDWENNVPARVLFTIPFFNPMRVAGRIRCPALIIGAENDSLIMIEAVEKMASRISNSTFVRLPCNHFEPYVGDFFEQIVKIESEFLTGHLFD